ncbi:putative membrane protein [Yersinia pestis PY-08]|uniref:Uncharacterized protein n=2 Tax=Yersinia pestis TaxID=632 RepID=A0AAV3BDX2_YERPE|nr:hypothetical protein YPIP275_0889 [Yersinia pestis biovar Orientalis str. IP275]EDR39783.1 hypothetical protein YpF1991016_1543 [Yersinia pestis biovar Orientalis str. F1991016]EDR55838.1 hypothetical protein YpMG051020_0046 [Yersinia pestis biovar Orientalis str. MG05-1020]EIR17040.1 putative membrane protein [Yersinia pestis PY-08]EIS16664.1 putative membrane protein [Yersinia pestis PY-52]EIS90164.1 putative membrane protein [Yersinia pestis PY-88]
MSVLIINIRLTHHFLFTFTKPINFTCHNIIFIYFVLKC